MKKVRIFRAWFSQEVDVLQQEANRLANLYWDYVNDLASRRPLEEIDPGWLLKGGCPVPMRW